MLRLVMLVVVLVTASFAISAVPAMRGVPPGYSGSTGPSLPPVW